MRLPKRGYCHHKINMNGFNTRYEDLVFKQFEFGWPDDHKILSK
jgi:hypothetical protein